MRWVQLCGSLSILWHCLSLGLEWKYLFQSCGHCWVFQICWHIECSTFTASSFRIWNSSTGIPSSPLALFVVMLHRAHLTLHSRMSGSKWVITPSWLSGLWRSFLYSSSVYSCHLCHLFLISSASVRSIPFLSFSVSPAYHCALNCAWYTEGSVLEPRVLSSIIWKSLKDRHLVPCLWKKLPCPLSLDFKFRWSWGQCPTIETSQLCSINWLGAGGWDRLGALDSTGSVQFSRSVMSNSLWSHGLQHARAPCPSPTPGVYSNSSPLWSQWCHPTISSSVIPFSSCL